MMFHQKQWGWRWVALLVMVSLALGMLPRHDTSTRVSAQNEPQGKLAEVLERGRLICGVDGNLPGFSFFDPDTDTVSGFDADFCRALTAAIFGEVTESNLEFRFLTAAERFTALQADEIDVLFRNTTWTLSRDTELQGDFTVVTFYDGQGLLVPLELGINSIEDMDGLTFCVQRGTTTEANIADALQSRNFEYELIPGESANDTVEDFATGRCNVLTSDKSQLAALRSTLDEPENYIILPDTLSKEPLGPMWLQGDTQWGDLIKWTVYATIQAEEFGITAENIEDFLASELPQIKRFVGTEGELGNLLGVNNDFAVNIIRTVGNYGEIYERSLSQIGIPRENSLNALWTQGGLIYAPAWR